MGECIYLSIKSPKASRALKQALDPGHKLPTLRAQLHFTMLATFDLRTWGPSFDQILDPHLFILTVTRCTVNDQPILSFSSHVHPLAVHLRMRLLSADGSIYQADEQLLYLHRKLTCDKLVS